MSLSPWLAGVVLGVYALLTLYALVAPARQPDPQRGVAIRCLSFVLVGLLGVAALLAAGILLNKPWLVQAISIVCLYSLVIVGIGLAKSGLDWFRRRKG
jgi:hypothetical protein